MTRDDIIEAASKAGFETKRDMIWVDQWEITPTLTRFAALLRDQMISEGWRQCAQGQKTSQHCGMVEQARAEEREACAQVAEGFDACDPKHIAAAIRARGQA